jgi:hypothetical protein
VVSSLLCSHLLLLQVRVEEAQNRSVTVDLILSSWQASRPPGGAPSRTHVSRRDRPRRGSVFSASIVPGSTPTGFKATSARSSTSRSGLWVALRARTFRRGARLCRTRKDHTNHPGQHAARHQHCCVELPSVGARGRWRERGRMDRVDRPRSVGGRRDRGPALTPRPAGRPLGAGTLRAETWAIAHPPRATAGWPG